MAEEPLCLSGVSVIVTDWWLIQDLLGCYLSHLTWRYWAVFPRNAVVDSHSVLSSCSVHIGVKSRCLDCGVYSMLKTSHSQLVFELKMPILSNVLSNDRMKLEHGTRVTWRRFVIMYHLSQEILQTLWMRLMAWCFIDAFCNVNLDILIKEFSFDSTSFEFNRKIPNGLKHFPLV